MKKIKPHNTKERGLIEFLIIRKGKNNFLGVCLTFNIVQEGKNPDKLLESLREAAKLHIQTILEKGLPESLLNRSAPEKYWKLYFKLREMPLRTRKTKLESFMTFSTIYPELSPAMS